jgi:L-ascorbate metabolism protein UlaG (beta-lactamase superfamily)
MRTLFAVLGWVWGGAVPLLAQGSPRLTITYLGNMGVAIAAGGRQVVIDGLHHGGVGGAYTAVPDDMLTALEQARAPFGRVDLLLVTHRHADHFDAASVRARLERDSLTTLVAARETVDSLFAPARLGGAAGRRARALTPAAGREELVEQNGIRVHVLDLPHNPVRTHRPENVGFLIELNGLTILHVGDADPDAAKFGPHRLAERKIDVAIVPYWYPDGKAELVRRLIAPRHVIATHVGPDDLAAVRGRVVRGFPGVVVFGRPGERWELR